MTTRRGLLAGLLLLALVIGMPIGMLSLGADPRQLIPSQWPQVSEISHWPAQVWQVIRFAYYDGSLFRVAVLLVLWS
ncbi:hypothetical protein [Actinocrispum wychmicini]|uniref:Uncharacterized protein n=1 Tax=Actinocrispum wychmicini TaxID=1213861 RepID=A0A4R2K440_9PSEU|nr:hypothetical protein [Actinocrispum wychmicini]TCO61095.1 hypothetical protein EV192_103679 [Actinocrispum wychmicini]